MKLTTRKRLLNLSSGLCLLLALGAGVWIWQASPPPLPELAEISVVSKTTNTVTPDSAAKLEPHHTSWKTELRQPLYDPPPPPKKVVKKKPRPINFKLVGTVIEPENSQAFLRLSSGSVELRRIGDQVTQDPRDGVIESITANEITIRREDDVVSLTTGNP